VIVVQPRTCRYTPNGYVRGVYSSVEIDAIGVYCPDLERCYLLPIRELAGKSWIHLRLRPARNNQKAGVRMASAYELGAIAQLGERLSGTQEVAGSSPASSTPPLNRVAAG
jgi:PD-(D/E)XK endonuclease